MKNQIQFPHEEKKNNNQNCNTYEFHNDHPGYQYSLLKEREIKCVPKLYYNKKFPDV
jgi:hypothetical protein